MERRHLLAITASCLLLPRLGVQAAQPAVVRLNELGPENEAMSKRAGLWDVTETAWDSPDAAPASTTGLVAKRQMIGPMLQETLHPAGDLSDASTLRTDYLTFDRVEGRWEYVSMDTRAPVGIMSAASFGRAEADQIRLVFQPFAVAGPGADATGQMLRMDQVITYQGQARDMKEQHFIMADGNGTAWLAHRYAYVQRP